ncbi:MAG: adenylyl-sulfate kinase [archaeon]|jgi:bifunctional enzyme CysN/CysC
MTERMNIVIVGHVDHGKSTLVGRLYADTNTLPEGKLDQIKKYCERNSKPFEYAFLLDALKDEQSQGITIDSSRSFFKTKKRDYDIIDAPGHIEFLKNMISGAARAEAAILLIDAKEGIQENSKRHAYLLSMLGIKQIIVCINKMDLVNYEEKKFEKIKKDYLAFLKKIGVTPNEIIPISAFNGENLIKKSTNFSWFKGSTLLEALDDFKKEKSLSEKPFRMFLQDVYKFTNYNDERRIFAGRINSGKINLGEKVIFLPSFKESTIKSIESFNEPEKKSSISAGYSVGFTLSEQIFVKRGELMCKKEEVNPLSSTTIKANLFWMSKKPFEKNKEYKLKIGTDTVKCYLKQVQKTLDTTYLKYSKKEKMERHEVAECVIECASPIVFEKLSESQELSRFVIVDEYLISGGGIIIDKIDNKENYLDEVSLREKKWYKSEITSIQRATRFEQEPLMVLITGKTGIEKQKIGIEFEKLLFEKGKNAYFLPIGNLLRGIDKDIPKTSAEHVRRLAETVNILMDTGLVVVVTLSDLEKEQLAEIKTIVGKNNVKTILVEKNHLDADLILGKEGYKKNASKIYDYLFKNKKEFIKDKNIFWHDFDITNKEREALLNQKGIVLWFTGLSASGKSTVACELQKVLLAKKKLSYVLDGDNVRCGLNKDLGFEPGARKENIRRVGEVAKLFYDSGIITITTFISPYREDRDIAKKIVGERFVEIYVECPVSECTKRDPKGLYKKAICGEIKNFTGISAPYEEPINPEITINTCKESPSQAVSKIMKYLREKNLF